ncbi:MAG: metallophosphoesterase family protein [Bacilli bacterium]
MNYFISDLHFRHENILSFDNRPFQTVQEMEAKIINNWNKKVNNKDTVYILGDFSLSRDEKVWIEILDKLNGKKVLIRGNHDIVKMSKKLSEKFIEITDYKMIKENGNKIIMSHYPILFYNHSSSKNTYMLYGHVHERYESQLIQYFVEQIKDLKSYSKDRYNQGQLYNVGCMLDYMDYTPRSLEEIIY